ncbi:MAG: hypothetical protein ACKOC6_11240 [bacterium]
MAEPSPTGTTPSLGHWARGVARGYLAVCAGALAWMVVETVLGFELRAGGILCAFLSVPWSMLAANLAPALPVGDSVVAGVLLRAALIAPMMGLNAAILRGIAARSERDLADRAAGRSSS